MKQERRYRAICTTCLQTNGWTDMAIPTITDPVTFGHRSGHSWPNSTKSGHSWSFGHTYKTFTFTCLLGPILTKVFLHTNIKDLDRDRHYKNHYKTTTTTHWKKKSLSFFTKKYLHIKASTKQKSQVKID